MLARTGRQPATVTTVSRGPASNEIAEWLGIEPDDEVVIRDCKVRARGGPPVVIATSYFPLWVVEARPNLENPA
jgi:DNA-binding GntR family transcriptional regulator